MRSPPPKSDNDKKRKGQINGAPGGNAVLFNQTSATAAFGPLLTIKANREKRAEWTVGGEDTKGRKAPNTIGGSTYKATVTSWG